MSDEFKEEDFNPEDNFGYGSVTLTFDDDTEEDFLILSIFEAGDNQYVALVELDEEGEPVDGADILLYRLVQNGEGEDPDLENIEDDDEYELASQTFADLMDGVEFDDGDNGTFEIELD